MRIQTNVNSLNAYRNLSNTNKKMSGSMEKLSSGFRINRAADDAAGLAISEKMRGQVSGLDQAVRNAQDSNSMIQTAEGALNESHQILQRMRELSVQSANDTNTAEDRAEIQAEVDQLAQEISRIADNTEFNTQNLLDGTFENTVFQIGANEGQNIELSVDNMDAKALNVQGEVYEAQAVTDVTNVEVASLNGEALDITYTALGDANADAVENTTAEWDEASNTITVTLAQEAGDGTDAGAITATDSDVMAALESVQGEAGIEVSSDGTVEDTTAITALPGDTSIAEADWVLDEEASEALGIDVSTQASADAAISTIDAAIESVSSQRSELGAVQNRLEHTIANLEVASENLTAAESRIRDVDMAKEMTNFSKQQILEQAGTAMLAQANQAPQSVLQLLG